MADTKEVGASSDAQVVDTKGVSAGGDWQSGLMDEALENVDSHFTKHLDKLWDVAEAELWKAHDESEDRLLKLVQTAVAEAGVLQHQQCQLSRFIRFMDVQMTKAEKAVAHAAAQRHTQQTAAVASHLASPSSQPGPSDLFQNLSPFPAMMPIMASPPPGLVATPPPGLALPPGSPWKDYALPPAFFEAPPAVVEGQGRGFANAAPAGPPSAPLPGLKVPPASSFQSPMMRPAAGAELPELPELDDEVKTPPPTPCRSTTPPPEPKRESPSMTFHTPGSVFESPRRPRLPSSPMPRTPQTPLPSTPKTLRDLWGSPMQGTPTRVKTPYLTPFGTPQRTRRASMGDTPMKSIMEA
eukprot:TRINITY_DN108637_c0_g1_i1.p1 TRINITY_DN108637_c0_g1~~TRINITY_DN108637_c0_g1_i1.p1  ORF type:complete len:354 (+),score=90.08 TRINITY_DN108637_c0_g1_i1:113-1174(+)